MTQATCGGCAERDRELEALRVEVATLRARPRPGRPPSAATSADAKLVQRVARATGKTKGEIATALGVDLAILSRSNETPLAAHHRDALREMLPAKPKTTRRGRKS